MAQTFSMDFDWRFSSDVPTVGGVHGHRQTYLSTKAGTAGGPASKNFDDSLWRQLDLPHDFVIETEIKEEYSESADHHYKGEAWYRKCFSLGNEFLEKQIALCFEGIAMQAEIFINGSLVRRSFSAYTEQFIDITDRVYVGGKPNTIAVHVNAASSLAECWSYEGGGIYRHVKLYAKDMKSHIAHNGIFSYAELRDEESKKWKLNIKTELENSGYDDTRCRLMIRIKDGDTVVAERLTDDIVLGGNSTSEITEEFTVSDPKLWDVDFPYMYEAEVKVIRDGSEVDSEQVRFGFRYYRFDADNGFFLNGRHLKLKGVSCHQDHAGVGVAIPDRLQYRRMEILKDMGVNMYRSGHNNPAKEVLDACDKLGILVIDENRHFEASDENLSHLAVTTKRDRNHPSVFLYCLLNEEPLQNTEEGAKIYKRMMEEVRKYDRTRLFTGAMHGNFEGAGRVMDVCGINYGYGYLDSLHSDNPGVCIIGSENNSQIATRGCCETDRNIKHVIADYDDEFVPWGATVKNSWNFARQRDYLAGVTVWTGFDYHGETVMPWPTVITEYGLIDLCGFYKNTAYFNKACFSDKPMIKLIPHWNFKDGETVRVIAVSNCEQTEIIINGRSYGISPSDCCKPVDVTVPFEKGQIEAFGYIGGKAVVHDEIYTSGDPYSVEIEASGSEFDDSGNDVVILNCSVNDSKGIHCPLADNKLYFDISGDAEIIGVGNGDPNSHESEVAGERSLYYGLCQVIVRIKRGATGVKITVRGDGLKEKTFVPVIKHRAIPYIPSSVNNYITRLEATSASGDYIDPTLETDINDMNTFLPVEIEDDSFQKDYRRGWKLYRAFLKLPDNEAGNRERDFSLYFDDVRVNKMYVYINGKEICSTNITHRYIEGPINCEFNAVEGSEIELRILVHINIESENGCGFRKSIRLI